MDQETTFLTLGCYGRTENGFVLCPSVHNRILKIDYSLVKIDEIIKYFEAVKLFDRPLLDQNAIRHLIYNLQDRFDQKFKRLWTDHEYNLLERFMIMHKQCGLYSQLILVPEENNSNNKPFTDSLFTKEYKILITASKEKEQEQGTITTRKPFRARG